MLNWNQKGEQLPYAKFYGCNTARGVYAQRFANRQGVVTYAQPNYSSFSKSPYEYERIKTHDKSLGIYMVVFEEKLGFIKTDVVAMKEFNPKKKGVTK